MNPVGQPRRARKLEFNRRGQGGNEMVMMTTWSVIHRARAAPSVRPSFRPSVRPSVRVRVRLTAVNDEDDRDCGQLHLS